MEITVGAKDFTEQRILSRIAVESLEAAGARVEEETEIGGTEQNRQAPVSGAIGGYWEYTGTGWIVHLGNKTGIPDARRQYEQVAERDQQENEIKWLAPAPANNTYAIAVREEAAEDLGVKTLSDFAQLIRERPDEASICVASEFATRPDGLPALERAYGVEFPDQGIKVLEDEGLVYRAVDSGTGCNFGSVFMTDGRIPAYELTIVKDDENVLPVYNPCFTLSLELAEEYPQVEDLFAPIAERLDNATLQRLSAAVDVDKKPPEEVARQFLQEEGCLSDEQLNTGRG